MWTPGGCSTCRATRPGDPIAISALYVEPTTAPTEGNRFPLVAFAHGTTGVGRECGISQAPFTDETPGNEYWRTLIGPMVDAGFAVVATDYEGMGAPGNYTYLLRKQSYDVLDSMRAALFFRPQRLDSLNLGGAGPQRRWLRGTDHRRYGCGLRTRTGHQGLDLPGPGRDPTDSGRDQRAAGVHRR